MPRASWVRFSDARGLRDRIEAWLHLEQEDVRGRWRVVTRREELQRIVDHLQAARMDLFPQPPGEEDRFTKPGDPNRFIRRTQSFHASRMIK